MSNPAIAECVGIIDLHHSDPEPDLPRAITEGGLQAILHKGTQGKNWKDPTFLRRVRGALSASLLGGAYHFGSNSAPGATQAQWFLDDISVLRAEDPDLVMALDFEHNPDLDGGDMRVATAREFVQAVFDATGVWCGFYSGHSRLMALNLQPGDVLGNCWLWIAQYGEEPHTVPPCWPQDEFWQYTNFGAGPHDQARYPRLMPGVGKVDRSRWRGTLPALRSRWSALARHAGSAPTPILTVP